MSAPSSAAKPSLALAHAMQRVEALVDWERMSRLSMRVDLAPVDDLLTRLGRPHARYRSVHVTGTKGKGSVCSLVDGGLRRAGWRTGRYTSPHLEKLNERIHLDGRPIADEPLAEALDAVLDARDLAVAAGSPGAQASWFDVLTATAFVAFARAGVEWAVVEVGLGGRLDSTNVVPSDVAVITNIGLEHTEVLGDTIEAIAGEKAGIIKAGKILVSPIAPSSVAGHVVFGRAAQLGAQARRVEAPEGATITEINLATARDVLAALGTLGVHGRDGATPIGAADLPDEVAADAAMPGRLERFHAPRPGSSSGSAQPITVILDGAHVDFALEGVLKELRRDPALQPAPVVLFALGRDKNATAMLDVLQGVAARVVCVTLHGGRPTWPADELADVASALGLSAETADSPEAGLARCLAIAGDHWVLVTGSLHLVGALRGALSAQA